MVMDHASTSQDLTTKFAALSVHQQPSTEEDDQKELLEVIEQTGSALDKWRRSKGVFTCFVRKPYPRPDLFILSRCRLFASSCSPYPGLQDHEVSRRAFNQFSDSAVESVPLCRNQQRRVFTLSCLRSDGCLSRVYQTDLARSKSL